MLNPKKMKTIIFFLLTLILVTGAAGYFVYQRNIFGQDRVRFEIVAPENVSLGEEIEYMLRYQNNSDVRLEEVDLIFEYPENVVPVEREEENDNIIRRGDFRRQVDVGELNPGEEKTISFKARLFGKEGDSFKASAVLRYTPRNLAARFEAPRTHTAIIDNLPINFELQLPSTVDPDREAGLRLRFYSEIDYPLTDIEIQMEYPENFQFIRSTPRSEVDERNRWIFPVLNRGDDAVVDIDGVVRGDAGDAKLFRARVGTRVNDRFVVLKEISRGTSISKSALLLDMQVNGDPEYIASPGELLQYEIFFRNIGSETLENLFLLVDLDKETLNLNQVEPLDGRFQKERGIIMWSYSFDYNLQSLREGEDGRVEFWVRTKDDLPQNPEIKVSAKMERAEKVLSTGVNTRLVLEQSALREGGPFDVVGPYPFEEEEKSSYTIKWDIESLFNDVRNVKISTKLPKNARITGEKVPEDISLSFASGTGEVKLELDHMSAGVPKEIFFEVEIEPSEEIEETDMAISETRIVAIDRRTDKEIIYQANPVFVNEIMDISL